MGLVRQGLRLVRVARPFAEGAVQADHSAQEPGIALVAGDPEVTRGLVQLLGVRATLNPASGLLALYPVGPSSAAGALAARLGERLGAGEPGLAVVVGDPQQRRELEAELRSVAPAIEASHVLHLERLDTAAARDRLLAVLGSRAVSLGRAHPRLRPAVARMLVRDSARRAGAIGMAGSLAGPAQMPLLMRLQARLVADLAALYGRPLGAERVLEMGAVALGAMGWRRLGRAAVAGLPAGWGTRPAIAVLATMVVGQAAALRLERGVQVVPAEIDAKARALLERLGAGGAR